MTQEQLAQAAVLFIQMGYRVLAQRVLLFLAFLGAIGLFSWAMYLGTALSLVAACAYAALILWPILRATPKESSSG